jgi:osmoprotectant transport system substrate-binding protein
MSRTPLPKNTKKTSVRRVLATAAAAPLLLLAACGGGEDALSGGPDDDTDTSGAGGEVVIAHQDYTEMAIMAEMYAAVLEAEGYEPTLKAVGDRAIYAGELASGKVDIAPEYVSSMTEFLNREANGADAEPVAGPDVDETMSKLEELAAEKGMTPLEPSEAEDANAFAVTRQFSEENDVTTLSDLGELGEPVALAAAPDCPERPDCQVGLEEVYGIQISDFQPLGFGSAQTKDALTSGEVQVGQVGTSDGQVEQLDLVVLEDDKDWQNAENLVPVASSEFLENNPEVADILNELSSTLTTEDLMTLNARVDGERQLPADVAQEYLEQKGLV